MQGLWNLIGKVQGPGKDFQYDILDVIPGLEGKSVWSLHNGKKRGTDEPVTIFVCDAKTSPPDEFQIAKNACRRLRSFRHPNILRFIDSSETEALIYMVTEPVMPLVNFLEEVDARNKSLIAWGIHQIANGLSFLINDGNLCHGNVNTFSIFVNSAGEWKVGGVEYVHAPENDSVGRLSSLTKYDTPEGKAAKKVVKWSVDSWGLGCLIWEVFNRVLEKSSDLKSVNKIPKSLVPHYCELVCANPKLRTNPKQFLENCMQSGQYLDNQFVKANLFLQEIQIKDITEQKEFFKSLNNSLDDFPEKFSVNKILPELLKAFEFGAAGSSVLGPLFKVGKLLEEEEYQKKIVPCVVKLFSSNDRATRIQLLQQMGNFVHYLQPSIVNNQIFPNVASGFGDTLPAMREQTVKAMILLTPKLSEKTINNQLLRYFAKLQMDEQKGDSMKVELIPQILKPGIRTNTTICLGKIAPHLPEATRQKVLVPAFLRGVRDPFPPARSAGIMAMAATQEYYSLQDIATRLLPSLCSLTVDPEKSVRENAFKALKAFVNKVEQASTDPDSILNNKDKQAAADGTSAGSWTGWAMSSLTSRFYSPGQQQQQPEQQQSAQKQPRTKAESSSITSEKTNAEASSRQPVSGGTTRSNLQVPITKGRESDQSGSEYSDAWSDDNWQDVKEEDTVSSMRNDLLAAREEITSFQTTQKGKTKSGNDSDSDYGDWGGDDWGFDEDKQAKSVAKKQSSKKATGHTKSKTDRNTNESSGETTRSVADILGMDSGGTDFFSSQSEKVDNEWSSGWELDSFSSPKKTVPPKKEEKTSKDSTFNEHQMKPLNTETDNFTGASDNGWNVEDDWGADTWSEGVTKGQNTVSQKSKDKETRQEELRRKREERKQQREQAQKDKKARTGGGALKLGAVKKGGKES